MSAMFVVPLFPFHCQGHNSAAKDPGEKKKKKKRNEHSLAPARQRRKEAQFIRLSNLSALKICVHMSMGKV